MERITIRLPHDLMELVKRKAHIQKIPLGLYIREVIKENLLQQPIIEEKPSTLLITPVERYLLKNSIETLLLFRRIYPEKDKSYLAQATEAAKAFVKQLVAEKNLIKDESSMET